jgi:hypothetical protein
VLVVTSRAGGAIAGLGFACLGAAGFVSLGLAGLGLAGLGLAGLEVVGSGGAGLAAGGVVGPEATESAATLGAAAGRVAAGSGAAVGGAGICTVGFVACAVVSGGKDALILLDEAPIAVVGSVGTLWGTEPSAFGAGVRRALRGRPEAGAGIPALGGFAILGFTPLFRHINEIRDRGAILPSA